MNKALPTPLQHEELVRLREQLLRVSPSKRVGLIIDQPKVRQVLKKLPPQDLLIAIHAAGIGDSLELIELLPPEQVQAIVDLETWQRDRIVPRRLASWLSILYAANKETALRQIVGLDPELLSLFLKIHTRVYDLGEEDDPEIYGKDYLQTPDNRYIVDFIPPPNLDYPEELDRVDPSDAIGTEVARAIIEGLITREPFTASRYLESVRWELPSELEETSLRWRSGRLADLGYPDMYEAMAIYAPLDPSNPPQTPAVDIIPDPDEPDAAMSLFSDEYSSAPLLRAAMKFLQQSDVNRVRRQMTALANRVAAAQSLSPGNLEALATVVDEASATVNLGLEFQSRGDLQQAAELLRSEALVILFRSGHSLARKLSRKARALFERMLVDDDHGLLPSVAEDVLAALDRPVPKLFKGLVKPGELGEQPFETLQELAQAAEFVADTSFAAALLVEVMGFDPMDADDLLAGEVNLGDARELDMDHILRTALCRASLGEEMSPQPLRPVQLAALRDLLAQDLAKFVQDSVDLVQQACRAHLPLPGASSESDVQGRAQRWCRKMGQGLKEQLLEVQGEADPRFVPMLLCYLED